MKKSAVEHFFSFFFLLSIIPLNSECHSPVPEDRADATCSQVAVPHRQRPAARSQGGGSSQVDPALLVDQVDVVALSYANGKCVV